ncbi:MAG: hypothetical protein IKT99_04695 [Oscillospiraceae bacterium]|nr:hypothetical protein [Oscillospiraceae bacterium]
MRPLWKQHTVDLGNNPSIEFYITKDGTEIYRGRAYKRPSENTIYVTLNDILAQHLDFLPAAGIDITQNRAVPLPFAATFRTYIAGATLKDASYFLLDWSYDDDQAAKLATEDWDGEDISLRDPVIDLWPERLPLLYAVPDAWSVTVYHGEPGEDDETLTLAKAGVFVLIPDDGGNFTFKDNTLDHTVTFKRKSYCGGDFALVYFNAYGGIDCLVCSGRAIHSRSFDKRTIDKVAKNTAAGINPEKRSRVNYATDEADRWQLSTPFLTDAQAAKMHHLLGSREVWLSLPGTSTFLPVNITDSECVDKTQRNQDGGMVAYTLNVELAEERRR